MVSKKNTIGLCIVLSLLYLLVQQGCRQEILSINPGKVDAELDTLEEKIILEGPSVMDDLNRYVWGASVIQGMDGLYHMFYSTWNAGKDSLTFGDSWVLRSEIGYAQSEFPGRDFQFKKIILRGRIHDGDSMAWDAQSVHNPHIKRFDGRYYLYYTGSMDPGIQPEGSPGEHVSKRNRVQQSQQVGVVEFETFPNLMAGEFTRLDKPLLSPRTRVKKDLVVSPSPDGTIAKPDNMVVVNPSVVFRPSDKKYLLYFKGNLYDPNWRGVHGIAISDFPSGPFTAQDDFVFDIKMSDGRIASAEDPYVWNSKKRGCFNAVIKDFSGRLSGVQSALAILTSQDGVTWQVAENPLFMEREVLLTNGKTIPVVHLERPQLLLDKNGIPLVLYAACAVESPYGKSTHNTFNVHIPLQNTSR